MRATQDLDVLTGQVTSRTSPRSLALALVTMGSVVAVDQLTKAWAQSRLVAGPCRPDGDECIDLVLGLRFHLVYNHGAAFSTGTGLGPLFGVIALIMTVVLLNMARSRVDRFGPLVLGAVAGGAIGNVLDRIFRADDGLLSGAVVDFIDLQWWPVFNVADAAVVVGVILFIIRAFFETEPEGDLVTADADTAEATDRAEGPSG
ncbi:MAG: signal peptidase II [Acidimicrobiales bacterium]